MGNRVNFTTKGGSNFTTRCLLLIAVLQVAAALSPLKACEDKNPNFCATKQKENSLNCKKSKVRAKCMRTCEACGPPPPIQSCTNKKDDGWCDKKLKTKARDRCKRGKSLLDKCTKTCGNLIGGSLVGAQMGCSFPGPPDCRPCDADGNHDGKDSETCPGEQVYNRCGSHCVKTCADPEPMCNKMCKAGCHCPQDKPLLLGEKCIAKADCPAGDGNDCPGEQVWNTCGSHCVKTCADPEPMCTKTCKAGCQCPQDKPLDEGGKCIAEADCPAGADAKPAKRSSLFASMKGEPGIFTGISDGMAVSTTIESFKDTKADTRPCC